MPKRCAISAYIVTAYRTRAGPQMHQWTLSTGAMLLEAKKLGPPGKQPSGPCSQPPKNWALRGGGLQALNETFSQPLV